MAHRTRPLAHLVAAALAITACGRTPPTEPAADRPVTGPQAAFTNGDFEADPIGAMPPACRSPPTSAGRTGGSSRSWRRW